MEWLNELGDNVIFLNKKYTIQEFSAFVKKAVKKGVKINYLKQNVKTFSDANNF